MNKREDLIKQMQALEALIELTEKTPEKKIGARQMAERGRAGKAGIAARNKGKAPKRGR